MKILVITDFDSVGSGYKALCAPLFTELARMGHEIKIIGLMYRGEEHYYPFSVLPAQSMQEVVGMANNLLDIPNVRAGLWPADVIIVAMDIPIQINLYNQLSVYKKKYIAITPLENGPLTPTWAMPLFQMDKVFFISELGKQEALKTGLKNVEHLRAGVDTVSFHPATPEEKMRLRDGLGIPQDAFVVLTVADNQERKNLWAALDAISKLKKDFPKPIRYALVTREQNPYGFKLKDLIKELDIQQEYIGFERGLPTKDLWGLYAASDVYLQPSKAEGLGLPVMDAMACGVPVVATNTGAMVELLEDNRGILVPAEYEFRDVWGNSKRSMIDRQKASDYLYNVFNKSLYPDTEKALEYIRSRTWDIPAKQIDDTLEELFNEPKEA